VASPGSTGSKSGVRGETGFGSFFGRGGFGLRLLWKHFEKKASLQEIKLRADGVEEWYNVAIDDISGLPSQEQQPWNVPLQVSASTVRDMKEASLAAGKVIKKTWEVIRV